ncbi:Uncharacterised protein [Mycobacterium tuberculosis]|nr:Uncharacterised protein [Mycobacterium tuberculosis]
MSIGSVSCSTNASARDSVGPCGSSRSATHGARLGVRVNPNASRASLLSSTPNRAPASVTHHSDSDVWAPGLLPVTATKFAWSGPK